MGLGRRSSARKHQQSKISIFFRKPNDESRKRLSKRRFGIPKIHLHGRGFHYRFGIRRNSMITEIKASLSENRFALHLNSEFFWRTKQPAERSFTFIAQARSFNRNLFIRKLLKLSDFISLAAAAAENRRPFKRHSEKKSFFAKQTLSFSHQRAGFAY